MILTVGYKFMCAMFVLCSGRVGVASFAVVDLLFDKDAREMKTRKSQYPVIFIALFSYM